MRLLQVNTLKGGERLAEAVTTEEKKILISKGTILKPEYLELISFLGIETVCIEDPYESYETPHYIVNKEKIEAYVGRIQGILEKHIYQKRNTLKKIKPLAEELVMELMATDKNLVIDIKERNGNLYEHTIMVTILSVMIGRKLELEENILYQLASGCLLHDLGLRYITVPYIDCDMDRNSASEIFEYKKHTILAYSVLEEEEWLEQNIKKMVLFHHEKLNGSGFPLKQKVKEMECNILQVCDTFDCFISGMECRRRSVQEAIQYLETQCDVLFDRKIVKVLKHLVALYPVGTKLKLNTDETGIVMSQTNSSIRPLIGIIDEEGNMTGQFYNLLNQKNISILQVERF